MKGCHSCEHAAAIAGGKYAGKVWEEIPCSGCDVMSGAGFAIEFDEGRMAVGSENCGQDRQDIRDLETDDRLPVSVMREIVVAFLKLKPELRDVVAWRYAGVKYGDIALIQGVSEACAEKRHRRAMALWPALRSLFPRKSGKQRMRKGRTGLKAETRKLKGGGT